MEEIKWFEHNLAKRCIKNLKKNGFEAYFQPKANNTIEFLKTKLRKFKTSVGLTPYSFRTQYKINMAKEMLKNKIPMKEVIFKTGFFDNSHFTRNFKKILGITPKAFQTSEIVY